MPRVRANESSEPQTLMKGPRILIVAASPRYVGGQSVMAQRLLSDLAAAGVPVGFVPVDPSLPRFLRPLDRIKYVRTLLRTIFYVWALLRHMPSYDVIHVFSASYTSFLISPTPALLIARLLRKRVILNYHSGEAEDHLSRSGALTKRLLAIPDRIVVPSEYLVSVFANFGFEAISIFNHIDASRFNYRERHCLHPRIIVARTLDTLYNIPCALRTFQVVQQFCPQAELVILGDGPQKEELERQAQDLNLENVTFRGFVDQLQMPHLYDEADVFLNTSSVDNMPISILEAFAAGLPVITTDAGGIPYVVIDGKNGLVASVDNHAALAQKLLDLIKNPEEVRRLSRAGREEIAKYSWDAVGPQWIAMYQRVHEARLEAQEIEQGQCQKIA